MKRILVPTKSGSDWQRLLAKPERHWKKGASAMTAAAAWEGADGALPKEISSLLQSTQDERLADLRMILAVPEWEVALVGGQTTSNTDVMAICRNEVGLCVIGVEAKVLEDFGPLVSAKRAEASKGQSARLAYLHELLRVEHFDDSIRYQLLHRTASSLLTAKEFHANSAVMLVHAFGCPDDRRRDFDSFVDAMGGERLTGDVSRVMSFDSPRLYLAWCNGEE